MKKLILILGSLVAISCSNPNSDSTDYLVTAPETVKKTEEKKTEDVLDNPKPVENPVVIPVENPAEKSSEIKEDKSPYEYVLPANVDMNDYVYVGDICFSDYLDFSKWSFTNGTKEYSNGTSPDVLLPIVLEKISRVYNDDPDTQVEFIVENKSVFVNKGTKYKLYINKVLVENPHGIRNDIIVTKTKRDGLTDPYFAISIKNNNYIITWFDTGNFWKYYKEKE